jgi:uncharacterized protein YbcI
MSASENDSAQDQVSTGQSPGARISTALVRLHKKYTGRGPVRARTVIGNGIVVCVLEDTLTHPERTLADAGQVGQVLAMRRSIQDVLRDEAVAAVEEATGRNVTTFMSENDIDPDVSAEVFVLQPSPDGDDTRSHR